ncbi:hypothetical protein [Polyangium jinanense]|uniref:Uncharacterized protein n=1 Tax=Polyangium jinanense TaxID=2829994 RepID=A0A9X3X443_9BACT|nr:hypothetical protein [Polyangium jinanense]MDC3954131.1 hypothetical protein [Polyangium jinanense]MDC3981913.1 hypothetical protein [Polyangium jinanense]
MSTTPNPMGADELAMRVVARSVPGAFFTLLAPDADVARAAAVVSEEISSFGDEAALRVEPKDALAFTRRIQEHASGPVVVSGVDGFTGTEWAHLDLLRSRLAHDGAIVLVMGEQSFARLMRAAPNFASFLGGSLWRWDRSSSILSHEEREARLRALQAWSGRTNDDVVSLAQRGELPRDPEYAEWLVLLDRGDLLER